MHRYTRPATTRVTHGGRATKCHGGVQHLAAFVLVGRGQDVHVRNAAQEAEVEGALVGGAVGADEPRAVDGEGDGQVLQGHVMDELVVAALQEAAVDGNNRAQPFAGHASGQRNGMLLGNAHVVVAVGVALGKFHQATAFAHGRGDAHNAGVVGGFIAQPFTKHLRVGGRAGLFLENGASARVERTGAMPLDGVRFGRRIALALAGDHVQKLRPARDAQAAERSHERGQVVAVDGANIVEAEFFEQRARQHHALQVLFGAACQFPHGGHALQHFLARALDGGVDAASEQLGEVVGKGTNVFADRHVIVVQHHEQVGVQAASVVHRFEGEARRHGAIANDRDAAALFTGTASPQRHTERGTDAGAGVAHAKGVVFALAADRERRQTIFQFDGGQLFAAAGEHLVRVGLVPYVPDEAVVGRVEHVMQRECKFDGAKARGEVAASLADSIDEEGA